MSSSVIRLGIAGGGQVGEGTLNHASRLDGVTVAGIAEPGEARREQLAQKHRVPVFASIDEMLAEGELDAVKVCTPNFLHADHAIACLEAGVHVLCEKPIATTLTDAGRMVEAAKAADRIFMVNFEYRQSLMFRRIKEILEAGEIGEVRNLWFYESRGAFLGQSGGWRFDPKRSGGLFTEKLCHYIDLAMWFADSAFLRVHVHSGGNTLPHYQVPDQAMAFFEMEEGKSFAMATHHGLAADHPGFIAGRGVFDLPADQWRQLGHASGFRIAGDRGAIVADDWTHDITVNHLEKAATANRGGWRMAHTRREDLSVHDPASLIHNQLGMLSFFLDAVRKGQTMIWPGEASLLAVAAAVDAAERALVDGEPINIASEAMQADAAV